MSAYSNMFYKVFPDEMMDMKREGSVHFVTNRRLPEQLLLTSRLSGKTHFDEFVCVKSNMHVHTHAL